MVWYKRLCANCTGTLNYENNKPKSDLYIYLPVFLFAEI